MRFVPRISFGRGGLKSSFREYGPTDVEMFRRESDVYGGREVAVLGLLAHGIEVFEPRLESMSANGMTVTGLLRGRYSTSKLAWQMQAVEVFLVPEKKP